VIVVPVVLLMIGIVVYFVLSKKATTDFVPVPATTSEVSPESSAIIVDGKNMDAKV